MKKLTLPIVVVVVVALLVTLALARPMSGTDRAEAAAAEKAAQAWLTKVDAGAYGDSWDAAAPYFRDAIARPDWVRAVSSVRDPIGAVKSRALSSAKYTRTLPGAPDGEYVVLEYETSFANKADATETVVPMRVGEAWMVSGYFVK